jgi:hypothetical protein
VTSLFISEYIYPLPQRGKKWKWKGSFEHFRPKEPTNSVRKMIKGNSTLPHILRGNVVRRRLPLFAVSSWKRLYPSRFVSYLCESISTYFLCKPEYIVPVYSRHEWKVDLNITYTSKSTDDRLLFYFNTHNEATIKVHVPLFVCIVQKEEIQFYVTPQTTILSEELIPLNLRRYSQYLILVGSYFRFQKSTPLVLIHIQINKLKFM